jgi:two-component system cell cycle response regulator
MRTKVSPGDTTGSRALRSLLALVLFGGTAVVALHDWLGVGGSGEFDSFVVRPLYDAVVVAAGVACLVRSRAVKGERWAWLLLGFGILSWAAGEIYWTALIANDPAPPYPSPADAFYLALYPLAYAGLALLIRARAHELDWRLWTDGLIAALGTAALGTAFVFDFVAERTVGTPIQVATSLAYPLSDISMLAMIVGVVALTGWRPGRTWSLLLAGLAAQVVADIAYTLHSVDGVAVAADWIDPIYLISAIFLGAVLWRPTATTIPPSGKIDDRRELMVPGLFAAVMIGIFAMQFMNATSSLTTVLWAATMVAVIARLAISVRENKSLLEQVRTDALTGLGSRGRMEVDLERCCARAGEGEPAALFLFDLNGFKLYNDTFGHPAGDVLLAQLGNEFRHAVGEDGTAYRIGGDEFCVLLTCDEKRIDAALRGAAQALTATVHGVQVAPSWGGVAIPREASDPPAILQLADIRMYAQKESRQAARGGPLPEIPGTVQSVGS